MISVFYGENTLASRSALNAEINNFRRRTSGGEIVRLNGDKITETDLIEALEAPSLFSVPRLVVVEGLLSRRKSKEKDKLIKKTVEKLKIQNSEFKILLWEPKAAAAGILGKFRKLPNSRVQEFRLAKLLFKLLDSLRPGNGRQMSLLMNQTLKDDPAELVMPMVGRRITELILASEGKEELLAEVQPEWRKKKLVLQARAWEIKSLLAAHRRLLEIDQANKTGLAAAGLAVHLDIWLASL